MKQSPRHVRFGVIGCGVIAYWSHLRELRTLKDARLVAVADPDAAARERARKLTAATAYENPADLLKRNDVDAVVISAPTHLHAPLAVAAAQAGKHIYVEKPVAATLEEALCLRDTVQQAGVYAAVGFNRRYHPLCIQARVLIKRGAIGPVRGVLSTFCEPVAVGSMPAWKRRRATGGGVLLDLASHHIDLLRWFLSDEVAETKAEIASLAAEGDQAWLSLRMKSGVGTRGFFSFQAGRADWLEFLGESGTLRVDRHRPSLSLRVSRRWGYGVRSAFPFPPSDVLRWWVTRLPRPSYEPSYRSALAAFIASIQGKKTDLASLEDGVRSLEVVLAAEHSARNGNP